LNKLILLLKNPFESGAEKLFGSFQQHKRQGKVSFFNLHKHHQKQDFSTNQARNQLGTPGWANSFLGGAQIF